MLNQPSALISEAQPSTIIETSASAWATQAGCFRSARAGHFYISHDKFLGSKSCQGWSFRPPLILTCAHDNCLSLQTLLRLTAQKLGQLQDRKDSHAQVTSRDIATLLGQKNVALARNKAQNLMKDEAVSNAMELLEMYCGMLLEGFSALENEYVFALTFFARCFMALMGAYEYSDSDLRLSPSLVEAASSIIYAAAFNDFHGMSLCFSFSFPSFSLSSWFQIWRRYAIYLCPVSDLTSRKPR